MEISRNRPTGSVDLSIVIPAYNEEGNVAELFERCERMLQQASFTGEVVFVNDGSTDGTLAAASELERRFGRVRVVSHQVRRGLSEALRTGFAQAKGRALVFYPADLQYAPEDIPRLVERLNEGYDLVTGWKQGSYSKALVSGIYNGLSRRLFNVGVHDLNSVKVFRRELLDIFTFRTDWHRYWVVIAAKAGYRIGEVKVPLHPRKSGKSKFGIWRIPGGVLDLIAVKFQTSFMQKPMLFFGGFGSFLIGCGFLVGLGALYLRFVMGEGYRPLLYLVILLAVFGLLLFVLGFLAEALAGLRDEIETMRKRPGSPLLERRPPIGRPSARRPYKSGPSRGGSGGRRRYGGGRSRRGGGRSSGRPRDGDAARSADGDRQNRSGGANARTPAAGSGSPPSNPSRQR